MSGDVSGGSLYSRREIFSIVMQLNGVITQFNPIGIIGMIFNSKCPEWKIAVPCACEIRADGMAGYVEFPGDLYGIQILKSTG